MLTNVALLLRFAQAERVKIDIEEAKFQAEERRKAIEKAKTLLYHQTDRVKKFHVSNEGGEGGW